jgi:alkanesulfonate monooxygenase SsuD/methylene tetrahydromethanopterin reductase-like flavin-dependent oxidoreductase (luciferase family)
MVLRPLQRPHPPLWYGTAFAESAPWPAANDVHIVTLGHRAGVRAITDRYRAERKRLGKDSESMCRGVTRHVVVADSDEAALRIARRAYPRWRESFTWLWRRHGVDVDKEFPIIAGLYPPTFDELMGNGNGFAGAPASVRKYVEDEVAETGINYLVSWLAFGNMTVEESLHSAELLARKVAPAFSPARVAAE